MILKVKKKEVKETITCPLCLSLFDHPTTIAECLHSFCRMCIYDKLITDKLNACPICKVDIGVNAFETLRVDYSLENRMLTLFPPKPKTVKATTEDIEAFFKSSTKKEKSLSSLLASSSRSSVTPDLNLDAPLEPDMLVVKKLSEQMVVVPQIQMSSKPMKTFLKRQRKNFKPKYFNAGLESEKPQKEAQVKFNIDLNIGLDNGLDEAGTSQGYIQMENNPEKDIEMIPTLSDTNIMPQVIVKPSTCQNGKETNGNVLVCGIDTKEVFGDNSDEYVVRETEEVTVEVHQNIILISSDGETEEEYGEKQKNNVEENQDCATSNLEKVSVEKQKNKNEKNQVYAPSSSGKMSGKKSKEKIDYTPRLLRPRKGRTVNVAASTSQDAITVEAENKAIGKDNAVLRINSTASTSQTTISVEAEKKVAVWFSLVASKNQNTSRQLSSMPRLYLRVTDGNVSVSHVKKYIVTKLCLKSEYEVEIWLRNEKVSSSMTLLNLVDRWVETTPSKERKSVMVGSSGAEFVMVLNYSRKETS